MNFTDKGLYFKEKLCLSLTAAVSAQFGFIIFGE